MEIKNYLSDAKSINISIDDYIYFQKLKEAENNSIRNEGLAIDPFFIDGNDRIVEYRVKMLKCLGFKAKGSNFERNLNGHEFLISTDVITKENDKDFFSAIDYIKEEYVK